MAATRKSHQTDNSGSSITNIDQSKQLPPSMVMDSISHFC